jgi:hypothetical protein
MNNIPTPRIDNAFKNPSYKNPRMNATLDSVYQEGKKLEKELVAAQRERDEAREALSALSLYLSMGIGDNSTTAQQYYERILEGMELLTTPIVEQLAATERERDEAREEIERIKNMLKKVRSMFNSIC